MGCGGDEVEVAVTAPVELVTGAEMAAIDRCTIATTGVTGAALMERAAAAVVEAIEARWDGLDGLTVVVVCGKGNNGGDGFAVARILREVGVDVGVFLSHPTEQIDGDAAAHLERLLATGPVLLAAGDAGVAEREAALGDADVVVDALLGTGTRGAPRQPIARLIEGIVGAGRPVVAVDLPSGVDADSGQAPGPCIAAVLTVTFGLPKRGQLLYPGRSLCGTLQLADIGLSRAAIAREGVSTFLVTEESASTLIPERPGDAHKGSCGSVAVIAGSVGMTGASALTAEAAQQAGAGRVVLGVPASLNDILEVKLTEVMTLPLPELRKRRCLALRSLSACLELAERSDVTAVGPGLGRHRETAELVRRLLPAVAGTLVLDADGLNAIADGAEILKERTGATVVTPHLGEFVLLSGCRMEAVRADPVEHARAFATEYGVTLVLKGAPTVVAAPDGRVLVNPTGNAGMATAGSGDVLTGLIAGFLAQDDSVEGGAVLGVFVHGRAGDMARDDLGEWGMLAGDIGRRAAVAIRNLACVGAGDDEAVHGS